MKLRKYLLFIFYLTVILGESVLARVRHYYIAAVEIGWDYSVPDLNDNSTDNYTQTSFKKIVYRRFTDEEFTEKSPHSPLLGYFGPVITGQVGDFIFIKLRNLASVPLSIVTDGVETSKNKTKITNPGEESSYEWKITEEYGPTHSDPICMPRLYYSDVNLNKDINSGLIGCFLVCKMYGVPSQKEMENILFFAITDESQSWIKSNKTSLDVKLKHSINGYSAKTFPTLDLCTHETQVFYLLAISPSPSSFPIIFEGVTVQVGSESSNIVNMFPGSTAVAMVTTPPDQGNWTITSGISRHQLEGMSLNLSIYDCTGGEHGQYPQNRQENYENQEESFEPQIKTRTYFLAAEEHFWNYAPSKYDYVTGDNLLEKGTSVYEKLKPTINRIGGMYKKVRYVEYKDGEFQQKKERSVDEKHLGFLGPILRVEVNEILRIVFKNNAKRLYNIYIPRLKMTSAFAIKGVRPRDDRTYYWKLDSNFRPLWNDPQCSTSIYYSSVDPVRDVESGLFGPLLICKTNSLRDDNKQKSIDKELALLFGVHDENLSWYIDENIRGTTGLIDDQFPAFKKSPDFISSNLMFGINGYGFGQIGDLHINVSEVTSLHFMCMGTESFSHTVGIANQDFVDQILAENGQLRPKRHSIVSLLPWNQVTKYLAPNREGSFTLEDYNWNANELGLKAQFLIERKNANNSNDQTQEIQRNIRWYYLAVVEVDWEYYPSDLSNNSKRTSHKKVMYQEFTDATFTMRKISALHLGVMGPLIKAEAGDIIKIALQNQACRPFSIRPKGLNFKEGDAGEWDLIPDSRDSCSGRFNSPGLVWPGHVHNYTWYVSDEVEPLELNGAAKCKPSFYYSGVDPTRDMNSGLLGPILICKKNAENQQTDHKNEIKTFFIILKEFDETSSWYYNENLERFQSELALNKSGHELFHISTMNGFANGSLPTLAMKSRERVVWHLVNADSTQHSISFERNLVAGSQSGETKVSSVKNLLPGESRTFLMIPFQEGTSKIRDFVTNNTQNGLFCYYSVTNSNCHKPLGMKSGQITDRQISASSTYVMRGLFGMTKGRWKPGNARLLNGGRTNAWIPARFDRMRPWLQVDLGSPMTVTGIILQGARIGHARKYVKSFRIIYSLDRNSWAYVNRIWSDHPMSFEGNFDDSTPVTREITPYIYARYIKILVTSYYNQPALRIELLGCKKKNGCENRLGLESVEGRPLRIPDESLSASSVYVYRRRWRWEPKYGRLNYRTSTTAPAWSPSKSSRRQWIQVDLGELLMVTGVVTQGAKYGSAPLFVKSFLVSYSVDGYNWNSITDSITGRKKIFHGNFDAETPLTQTFESPIQARYVRIKPWYWSGRIALRFEVIGCRIDKENAEPDVEEVPPFPEECIAELI